MLNHKLIRQSLDFEENDTAEIFGTEYNMREDFKESAPEIDIEIPLSMLLSTNSIRPGKELPRSCQLNHSQSLHRTQR